MNAFLKLILLCSLSLNGYFIWQLFNPVKPKQIETVATTPIVKKSAVLPAHFQQAVALFSNQLFDKAVAEYTQLLVNEPRYARQLKQIWQQQLETWLSHQKFTLSEQFLTAFLNSHPYDVTMLELEAKRLIAQGDTQQGIISLLALSNQLDSNEKQQLSKQIDELSTTYIDELIAAQQWQALLNSSQQWLDYAPGNAHYLYNHALANYHLEDYVASQITLDQLPEDHEYKQQAEQLHLLIQQALAGVEVIKLTARGSHYLVNSIINDDIETELMIDTGASFTVINQTQLNSLNSPANYLGTLEVNTANGVVEAQRYQLESFQVGQQRIRNFEVLVIENHVGYGLLGMNFLENFKFNINQQVNELELIKNNF